jgi:L-2,4-diaminobutyric acid acetyltransferase
LDVSLEREKIDESGTEVYWSCGMEEKSGKLKVGSERGIALLSWGDTIDEANQKVETAVSAIKGDFHYRSDIAAPLMLRKKLENIRVLTGEKIRFRIANGTDFMEVHDFVSMCPPLESYAEHVYKILLRYFGNSCFIAELRKRIVGFVLGFISQTDSQKTYFLWQIGVAPFMQGTGTGTRLLEYVEAHVGDLGCERIEVTIDPENISSQKLFEKMEFRNISKREGKTVKVNGNLAVKDYYKPGRHFMLYEKKLK